MTEQDIAAARALWAETEGVHVGTGDEPEELAAYLRRNPGLSTVAVTDGRLVGAVMCGHDGRRGLVYHLAVAREHRGRGIAAAMMARSLPLLRDAGIRRVILLVATDNPAGREFWLKQGWEGMDHAYPMALDL